MSEQAPPALMLELWADALEHAIRDARDPLPEDLFDRARELLSEKGLPAGPEDVLTVVGHAAGRMARSRLIADLLTRVEDLNAALATADRMLRTEIARSGRTCSEGELALLASFQRNLGGLVR